VPREGRRRKVRKKMSEVRCSPRHGQSVRWRTRRMEPQGCERHRWVKPRGRKERERVSQSVRWRTRGRKSAAYVRQRPDYGEPGKSARGCFLTNDFRSERFTAFELENTLATSGSKTTTFVPCAWRRAYFPRTPCEKSYSFRIDSRVDLLRVFLI